jgi:hypothetical protein
VVVAQESKEKGQPKAAEGPRAQPPVTPPPSGNPKLIPNTTPDLRKEDPRPEPKREDPKPEPKKDTPKIVEMPKTEPKKEPKTEPKKEATVSISFEKQVKPILMRYCGDCHGNAGKPKGDVDLRTLASIKELKTTLVPGDPNKSRVYESITEMSMPPGGKPRPGKGETDLIREWIAGGAKPRRRKLRRPG